MDELNWITHNHMYSGMGENRISYHIIGYDDAQIKYWLETSIDPDEDENYIRNRKNRDGRDNVWRFIDWWGTPTLFDRYNESDDGFMCDIFKNGTYSLNWDLGIGDGFVEYIYNDDPDGDLYALLGTLLNDDYTFTKIQSHDLTSPIIEAIQKNKYSRPTDHKFAKLFVDHFNSTNGKTRWD